MRWLIVLCICSFVSLAQAAPVELRPEQDQIELWQELTTLVDPQGSYTPAQAEQQIAQGNGQILKHPHQVYDRWPAYPYWAVVTLRNASDQPKSWILTYLFPNQDHVDLWQKSSSPASGEWQAMRQLEDERPYQLGSGTLYPAWRINLKAGETLQLLVRLEGNNLMRFPLQIMSDAAYTKLQSHLHFWLGLLIVIPLVVVLYALTLISIAQDKSLPIFFAMAASELVGSLWLSGGMHELFPWISRAQGGWIGWASYVLLLGLSAFHARVFLQTKERDPLSDKLLCLAAACWFIAMPLAALIWPEASRRALVLVSTGHAFGMCCLAAHYYRRQRNTHMLLFLLVWTVYAAAALLHVIYRVWQLPVHITLISIIVQGALVASILGCAVSVQILTKRRNLMQEIDRARDRAMLYASAHHDLWQPLQSIQFSAHALAHAASDERDRALRTLDSAMSSVREFMHSLRELPQTESDHASLPLVAVRLDNVLSPLVDEFREWTAIKTIQLRYLPSPRLVQTNVQALQRIVRNMLSNAVRYTNPGGRILLGIRRQSGMLWLVVLDTGIGMDEQATASCFQAFKRFGHLDRIPDGMGLGLYTIKRLSVQLGSRVVLKSVKDKGTMIGVQLTEFVPSSEN
jgi:signal transduction histidine kinase